MTGRQAEEIATMVAHSFPVPAWASETILIYIEEIEDLDYELTVKAMREWRRTHRERPTIADIRKVAMRPSDRPFVC